MYRMILSSMNKLIKVNKNEKMYRMIISSMNKLIKVNKNEKCIE